MSKSWTGFDFRKLALVVFAMFMIAATSCELESSDSSTSVGDATSAAESSVPAAGSAPTADSGLDEACVQRVLGRAATGFADITAAERDAVFEQCSGSEQEQLTRRFATGGAGDILESLDEACVTEITGEDDLDLGSLSIEQRQEIFTECAPEDFQRRPGGDRFGGGGFTGGAFADIEELLAGCVTDALGETPEDLFALDPEQLAVVSEACRDELPDGFDRFQQAGFGQGFFGGGGDGGFGGGGFGGGGFLGGEGGGGFGAGLDFASDCVTSTVGRPVTGPADLTRAEIQQIFATCLQPAQ